jgi:hypothetical protein
MDFATSIVPGWHTTIFPPYFVAGAIFSGFAMVLTLALIMRKVLNLEHYITVKHVEYMNIIIMLTGSTGDRPEAAAESRGRAAQGAPRGPPFTLEEREDDQEEDEISRGCCLYACHVVNPYYLA